MEIYILFHFWQEREKERKVKDQLEKNIRAKDDQLQALLNKQSEVLK